MKRVYRLYLEERLSVRRRQRKHLVRDRALATRLIRPNQEWAMDFGAPCWRGGRDELVIESFRLLALDRPL